MPVLFTIVMLISCESEKTKRDRFFLLGNEALEKKEFNTAIEYYDQALKIDSDHIFSYNNRGVAKMEDGRPYEAIQDYNQALIIDQNYWECLENRARAYEKVGKFQSSLEDLDILIRQFPDTAKFLMEKGVILSSMERFTGSYQSFMDAKELKPSDPEIEVNIATVEFFMDSLENAEKRLQKVIEEYPQLPNAYNTLNQVYLEQGRYSDALKMISKALEFRSDDPFFLNNRGFTLLMLDSLNAGLRDINQSILLDPENLWAYRNKGIYHLRNQEPELSMPYLRKSAESGQKVDQAYYYLGLAYFDNNQKEKACDAWLNGKKQKDPLSEKSYNAHCQ